LNFKNEFIIEPLVDRKKVYKFNIEFENLEERKTSYFSLRNEFYDNLRLDSKSVNYMSTIGSLNTVQNQTVLPDQDKKEQVSYMSSQNMYESSLSEELSVFDFTGANEKVRFIIEIESERLI
jgi:hypothetical protein